MKLKKTNNFFTIHHYVDDRFLAFDNQIAIGIIYNLFNSIHNNITFTKILEENNHLSFVVVNIAKT